jgi:hypothetical protein
LTVAVVVTALLGAGQASAAGGPEWLFKGAKLSGTKTYTWTATTTTKINTTINISCTKASTSGEIQGGNPGLGAATITLSGCSLEGHPKCTFSTGGVVGQVTLSAKLLLAYPAGLLETETEALVALVPVGTMSEPNKFGEGTLQNELGTTECGTRNGELLTFNATGTKITKPAYEKNCGLLATIGTIEGGKFVVTAAGKEVTEGALNFTTLPNKASMWTGTAFSEIKCTTETVGLGNTVLLSLFKTEAEKSLFGWTI